MPNPGSFLGPRGEFLKAQLAVYADAVKDSHVADTVADIQRRYFLRWPTTLPHDQEQTQEWLDNVNDSMVEEEIATPDVDDMSPEEAAQALAEYDKLAKELKLRKESIKRRMSYMHSKSGGDNSSGGKKIDEVLDALVAQLTGVDVKVPRIKTAYNVWGPLHRNLVDPVFKERVKAKSIPSNQHIALRSAVYKELFAEQPQETQDRYTKQAVREHEKVVRKLGQKAAQRASTMPHDRQIVISNLAKVVEPILDLLREHTGFQFSMMAGGPEPADGGRLNMICIHSGYSGGSVKMDFGRTERVAFKEAITPAFGRFLKRSYTIEECRSRALPRDHNLLTHTLAASVPELDEDNDSITTHRFTIDKEHVEASHSSLVAQGKRLFEGTVPKPKKTPNPPPVGIPSPIVRFFPPIGKSKKLCELPSNDKPKGSTVPATPSPLSQTAAFSSSSSGPLTSPAVAESQALGVEPRPSVTGTPDALPCHSSPGPSRPVSPVPSRPVSPAPSRPVSPVPSKPIPPISTQLIPPGPSQPFSPNPAHTASSPPVSPIPSRPVLPAPPRLVSPVPPRLILPLPARSVPSRSGTPPPSELPTASQLVSTTQLHGQQLGDSLPVSTVQTVPPSGTATVPDLSSVTDVPSRNLRKRKFPDNNESSSTASKRKAPPGPIPAAKKQRVLSGDAAPSASFDVDVPMDGPGPDWARNALELLTREDLGPQWRLLVAAWLEREVQTGFIDRERLSAKGRPPVVGLWIKKGRTGNWTFAPTIESIAEYERQFTAWWEGVQPEWRAVGDTRVRRGRNSSDWSNLTLRSTGPNGLISAVAALYFWGSAKLTHRQHNAWNDAVDDVLHVIQQLT